MTETSKYDADGQTALAVETDPSASSPGPLVRIIGIGASAGGLEALSEFLKNVPSPSGAAFVVVQHLDPDRTDMMPELLQRCSTMPVHQVRDGERLEPDHVYVIPPNRVMSVLHGVLHLFEPPEERAARRPIDIFFRSLAEDQQAQSMAVILSGMGSDGTLGFRAVKERGGITFAQAPSSAKFDSMPRSVVDSGLADVVAPIEELPSKILGLLRNAPRFARSETAESSEVQSDLEKIFILLRAETGHDFSLYKKTTVCRRIERRMALHEIETSGLYVRYLQTNPQELQLLFKELLIGVTNFFRDPSAWAQLKREALTGALSACPSGGAVRAWCAGCSTGEEAYSLAIMCEEALEELGRAGQVKIQIFATDIDADAIERARTGVYPDSIRTDVSQERLDKFFSETDQGFQVSKRIRESIVFAEQDVILDPPFTRLDLLVCRNLLIYLAAELQKKILPLFSYGLKPGGYLFLGSAESIGSLSHVFRSVGGKARIFQRTTAELPLGSVDFPPAWTPSLPVAPTDPDPFEKPISDLQTLTERTLLQHYTPPAVLTTMSGDILCISGRTGRYLEPPSGKVNWNVFAMAREGLRGPLKRAYMKLENAPRETTFEDITIGANGGAEMIDLTVKPIPRRDGAALVLAILKPKNAVKPLRKQKVRESAASGAEELERQLEMMRSELQTARDETQAIEEKARAFNEELQSTNEELQSSNEELTTSKEEMQSLNEELQTVNRELEGKVEQLSQANSDLSNLLNSTEINTLFLDERLCVRRFTNHISKIFNLLPGDVGRPITDITSALDYPDLVRDAQSVLQTLRFSEREVPARGECWYTVRIMPYRSSENRIEGLVITFHDISAAKTLEKKLIMERGRANQILNAAPVIVWSCDEKGHATYLSPQWETYTGIGAERQLGTGWIERVHPEDRVRIQEAWQAADRGSAVELDVRLAGSDGRFAAFHTIFTTVRDPENRIVGRYAIGAHIELPGG